jgi:hypothetical protein
MKNLEFIAKRSQADRAKSWSRRARESPRRVAGRASGAGRDSDRLEAIEQEGSKGGGGFLIDSGREGSEENQAGA